MHKLGIASISHISRFIQHEGGEKITVSRELIEDIADYILDPELEKATKDKEIYFFQRLGWEITQREVFNPGDATVMIRARFNFLIV